jgi:hypothetical protein
VAMAMELMDSSAAEAPVKMEPVAEVTFSVVAEGASVLTINVEVGTKL